MADWVEIVVPIDPGGPKGLVEDIASLVASEIQAAAAGTEQRANEVVFWVDALAVPDALAEVQTAAHRWVAQGVQLNPHGVHAAPAVPESVWRDAWKRHFTATRLTRQFVVVPSWATHTAEPDDIVIHLDPGMAFGTGAHASTSLVLEEMQHLADCGPQPDRILDVGCGSGILSIAAAKRWPRATCLAVDIDPIAVQVTLENSLRNQVDRRITATTEPLRGTGERFPLVLANILADALRELASVLIARTEQTLVLSGLLSEQAAPLASEFVASGMQLVRIRASANDPQWSSVVLRAQ